MHNFCNAHCSEQVPAVAVVLYSSVIPHTLLLLAATVIILGSVSSLRQCKGFLN